jgi:hypothetical protein
MFSMPDAMKPGANPLESSLIGVRAVKLPCFFPRLPSVRLPFVSFPWVTRFSSRSTRWPPHDGFRGEASQSVSRPCERLLAGSRLSTGSPCPSSPRERSGSPSRANCFCGPPSHSGCGAAEGRHRLLAEAKLGLVAPHAVQDDGELAGDGDAGARHAAPLGDLHAPGAQARPFAAPHEQRVGCLIAAR